MKFFEKYFPETRRFRIFAGVYLGLFLILFGYLFFRQIWERDAYLEKERIQGQRRILKPGARGDVVDRENNLLIGNRAHYSATLHLELLNKEIWEEKVKLRRLSYSMREELSKFNHLDLVDLLNHCFTNDHVSKRAITLSGKVISPDRKVVAWINKKQLSVKQSGNSWHCRIEKSLAKEFRSFRVNNSENHLLSDVGGLFSLDYDLDPHGVPLAKVSGAKINQSWFRNLFNGTKDGSIDFSVNGFSHSWEARYAVVQNYLSEVNRLTGRNSDLTMNDIQKHWRRKPRSSPRSLWRSNQRRICSSSRETSTRIAYSGSSKSGPVLSGKLPCFSCFGICGQWL